MDKVNERQTDEVEVSKSPRADAFKEQLLKEEAELKDKIKPYREFYEAHVNDPKYLESRSKIKEINAELAKVHNELAGLARAAGSKGIKAELGVFSSGDGKDG